MITPNPDYWGYMYRDEDGNLQSGTEIVYNYDEEPEEDEEEENE